MKKRSDFPTSLLSLGPLLLSNARACSCRRRFTYSDLLGPCANLDNPLTNTLVCTWREGVANIMLQRHNVHGALIINLLCVL